jgi:hypothetical protein
MKGRGDTSPLWFYPPKVNIFLVNRRLAHSSKWWQKSNTLSQFFSLNVQDKKKKKSPSISGFKSKYFFQAIHFFLPVQSSKLSPQYMQNIEYKDCGLLPPSRLAAAMTGSNHHGRGRGAVRKRSSLSPLGQLNQTKYSSTTIEHGDILPITF